MPLQLSCASFLSFCLSNCFRLQLIVKSSFNNYISLISFFKLKTQNPKTVLFLKRLLRSTSTSLLEYALHFSLPAGNVSSFIVDFTIKLYKIESFCGDAATFILLFVHYLVTVLRFICNQLLAETWCRSYHSHRIDGLALVILTDPDTGNSIIIIQYFFKYLYFKQIKFLAAQNT